MKKALKYTLSTLVAAAVVAPVYANDIIDNLTVKAAATYTEPSNNGLAFAWASIQSGGGATSVWRPLFVEPNHEWDYSLGLEYHLPDSSTRAVFEYDYYRHADARTAYGAAAMGVAAAGANVVEGRVTHKDRDFKLGLRHTVDLGPKFDLVLGGLIQYARAQRTFIERFSNGAAATTYFRTTLDEAEGWGPHVDALGRAYPWGKRGNSCWSLWARGGVGLLYTDQLYRQITTVGTGGAPAPFLTNGSIDGEEAQSVVAKVEADMGVEFTRVMKADFSDMQLGLRLGLRYSNMLNAFKNGAYTQLAIPGTYPGGINNTARDDFGRMGGFLEFRLGGANA